MTDDFSYVFKLLGEGNGGAYFKNGCLVCGIALP